jgi:hypothetical protein
MAKIEGLMEDAIFLQWLASLEKNLAIKNINNSLKDAKERLKKVKSPENVETSLLIDITYSEFNKADWTHNDKQVETIFSSLYGASPNPVQGTMPIYTGYVEEYVLTERKKQLEDLKKRFLGVTNDASSAATPADCPSPPRPLGIFGGGTKANGAMASGIVQCGSLNLPAQAPDNYVDLARLIPYFPEKKDVVSGKMDTKLKEVPGYQVVGVKHLTRRAGNNISYINSADYRSKVWECLAQKIQTSWEMACAQSVFIPFRMFAGYREEGTPNINKGISLHDLGLAIDIDPSLNGNGLDWTKGVFTNAWLQGTVGHEEMDALGVYADKIYDLADNVYEDVTGGSDIPIVSVLPWWFRGDRYRRSEDYDDAFGVYEEDLGTYLKSQHKDNIICPINSNPLLWVLVFCETSGMKWGNGTFMRKRYRGGHDWLPAEKAKLDRIFKINNVVDRVRAISWKTKGLNSHMHFQYWGGDSTITYEEIGEAARLSGVDYGL